MAILRNIRFLEILPTSFWFLVRYLRVDPDTEQAWHDPGAFRPEVSIKFTEA